MEMLIQSSDDNIAAPGIAGRQSDGEVAAGTTSLPIGAIIGIALVGSVMLFGVLTLTIMHYLRSRYSVKNSSRDLDLCDDNEDDILDALRSTRPPDSGVTTKIRQKTSNVRSGSLQEERTEIPYSSPLKNSMLMPPAYAFENIGLQDLWPLVGRVESPSAVPLTANKYPAINSGNADQRRSYSAFPLSIDNEIPWPQPTLSRSSSHTRGLDYRSIHQSRHSAKSSITSLKRLSSTRKSISDDQLKSILRSTSQRLREAQLRPLSRSISVMSQVSGAPPTTKPPSPPGNQRRENCEELIETDNVSLIDSVRSSVLNSTSQTPSPQKMTLRITDKIEGNEEKTSPANSDASESDSLCPSKTSDLFIPATLSLPTKPGARFDQSYEMAVSSPAEPSAKISRDNRKSILAACGTEVIHNIQSPKQLDSNSDPFVFVDPKAKSAFKSKSIEGPRPLIKRQDVFEQRPNSKGCENLSSPLRIVSGNQKSPTKSVPASAVLLGPTQENPFQWSPRCSPSLVLSPAQKPTGIWPKGHRRRRTVRLSHVIRPASVAVVPEEPENGSVLPRINKSVETDDLHAVLPAELLGKTTDSNHSQISSSRPPSVSNFKPFLAVSLPEPTKSNKISSDGPYSATLSFYNHYSSNGAFPSNHGIPERDQSPTPSIKKSRRRGCNFSIDITGTRDVALLDTTISTLHIDRTLPSPQPVVAQSSTFEISNDLITTSALTPPLQEPATRLPSAINNSVTSSVSLLRRMNSEISTYSTGSSCSDHLNGSQSIPELRGYGLSPIKRGSEGTMNYLNIGVKAPSTPARRGRTRAPGTAGNSRVYRQSVVLEDGMECYDVPGLVTPILENSHATLPTVQPQSNVSVGVDWPCTPTDLSSMSPKRPSSPRQTKGPAAQLQPLSTATLSQEYCHSCEKPLSPLRLNPSDSTIASCYHDSCLRCSMCNESLGRAFAIDKKPYCQQHYYAKLNDTCDFHSNPSTRIEQDSSDHRWSEVMTTPVKKSVHYESQLELPSPHHGSPKSLVERGSLGLYDEMGFLKSSPDRVNAVGSFELGPADNLNAAT